MTERCGCGEPLHYNDPAIETMVTAMVADLGPCIPIKVEGKGEWKVPRHFIAAHGIKAIDIPALAEQYGWERV